MFGEGSGGIPLVRQNASGRRREDHRAFERIFPMLRYPRQMKDDPKELYLTKYTETVYNNRCTFMKTAIYARVSTSDQNCESQLKELREYIARRGWTVAAEYVDHGFSGAKASRPALDSLMKAAALRKFSCVAVYKLDRFGRSVLHLSQQLAALESYGIRFIAISQGLDTDASNPTSRLLTGILSCVAEFERELLRERTLSGIRAAQQAGKHVGRPRRIFRRDLVVKLRDDEGRSWRSIAAELDIPTMTAVAAYREFQAESGRTETVPSKMPVQPAKTQRRKRAS
jgi:DNA invertase Pin-like site-specific DNA recombinase